MEESDVHERSGMDDAEMDGFFDMFGDDFFDIEGPDGKKTEIKDPNVRRFLAAQRRAAQAEYEEVLLVEVRKLQQSSALDVVARKRQARELTEKKARAEKMRQDEEARRTKAIAKEAREAAVERQQEEEWLRKQKEAEARTDEIERTKLAVLKRERDERLAAIQLAREKQEAISAKAQRDIERAAAVRLQLEAQRQQALNERMAERRRDMIAANQRKAQVAAERVAKAWENRVAASDDAEKTLRSKLAQSEERLGRMQAQRGAQLAQAKQQSTEKRASIEQLITAQITAENKHMDELDAAYSARLDAQAEAERKLARELEVKSVERLAQQHEARERVRVVQEARRAHLAEIEAKWATKWNKSNELSQSRDDAMRSRRSFIGLLATERQAVVNAMQEAKVTKRFVLPPHIRKNIKDPTLKLVLTKADPHATGSITLDKLNDVLGAMDATVFEASAGNASADEGGSLSDSEQRRAQSLFSKLDSNADGKLDLKEFTQVVIKLIRARGEPARSSQWLRTLFERVDVDADGLVECDELIAAVGMLFAEPDPHATGRLRTAQSSPGSLATPSMMSEPGEGSPGPSRAVSAEPCAAGADL